MPARKRSNRVVKKTSQRKYVKYLIYGVLLLFVFILFRKFTVNKYYSGQDKLILSVQGKSGDISVIIFDLDDHEINKIILPGSLEVEAARNLGKFRLKNIWELGSQEGIGGGQLLTQTLTSYLKFPVYIWAGDEGLNFAGTNPLTCFKPVFSPFKTNLSVGDKLDLANFCMKVKNIDRSEIDLSHSTFLKKAKLADGEDGYQLVGLPAPKLYSNFNYHLLSGSEFKISVTDSSNNINSTRKAGEIIEIMGSKVSSVTKSGSVDAFCTIKSINLKAAELFAHTFGCDIKAGEVRNEKSIEIILGTKFPEVF